MRFINKSCPILLLPLWWVFWLLHFLLFNLYSFSRNKYLYIKGCKRDEDEKITVDFDADQDEEKESDDDSTEDYLEV